MPLRSPLLIRRSRILWSTARDKSCTFLCIFRTLLTRSPALAAPQTPTSCYHYALGSPIDTSDGQGRHEPIRVVLKAGLSICRSIWARRGAEGAFSTALKGFEGALKER